MNLESQNKLTLEFDAYIERLGKFLANKNFLEDAKRIEMISSEIVTAEENKHKMINKGTKL